MTATDKPKHPVQKSAKSRHPSTSGVASGSPQGRGRATRDVSAKRSRETPRPKRHRASQPEDFKTSMLNVRVKDELKADAMRALEKLGISLPEAVRVFLGRIVHEQAIPFPLEVPNAETARALRESATEDRQRFTSAGAMFDELESGVT